VVKSCGLDLKVDRLVAVSHATRHGVLKEHLA